MEGMLPVEVSRERQSALPASEHISYRLFNQSEPDPIAGETGAFDYDALPFESAHFLTSEMLEPDAVLAFNSTEDLYGSSGFAASERYQEPLDFPAAGETSYESPKPSSFSDDSQSVRPLPICP